MLKDFLGSKKVQEILGGNFNSELSQVFEKVGLQIQVKKAAGYGIDLFKRPDILNPLRARPLLLAELASFYNAKTIAEVGTAQGLQSITFAESLKATDGSTVYTCDPIDVRDSSFSNYSNLRYTKGTAINLRDSIQENDDKIDLFWIDGAHDHYSVVSDFITLHQCAKEDTVWVFDDFDKRFGCYFDIGTIIASAKDSIVLNLGKTASDNPNIIAIAKGF